MQCIGFVGGLLFSFIRIHTYHAPFGLAWMLATQLMGAEPMFSGLGILLGSLLKRPILLTEPASAALYFIVYAILLIFSERVRPSIRFLVFLLCCAISSPLTLMHDPMELLYQLVSLGIIVAASFPMRRALRAIKTLRKTRRLTDAEQGSIVFVFGLLLLVLEPLHGFSLSVSVILLLFSSMLAVHLRSSYGTVASVLMALILSLYVKNDGWMIGAVALSSVSAAYLSDRGRSAIVMAHLLSVILFGFFTKESAHVANLPNLCVATALFALFPSAWLEQLRMMTVTQTIVSESLRLSQEAWRESTKAELLHTGIMLSGMSELFDRSEESDLVAEWTMRAALTVCNGCEVRRICWANQELMQTTLCATAELLDGGHTVSIIEPIDSDCRHFGDLCASVRLAYAQAKSQEALIKREQDLDDFLNRQFRGAGEAVLQLTDALTLRQANEGEQEEQLFLSLLEQGLPILSVTMGTRCDRMTVRLTLESVRTLKEHTIVHAASVALDHRMRCISMEVSDPLCIVHLEPQTNLTAEFQSASLALHDGINGDSFGECRLFGGRVLYAISDGMGSGMRAERESRTALKLLFDLYRMGLRRELIYENVNRMLLSKGHEDMYATLDALNIDLTTGNCSVMKYGAPPSYLYRDGILRMLSGEALPCGIFDDAKPSVQELTLKEKDVIVLCSDGVFDAIQEDTESILKQSLKEGDRCADAILQSALQTGQRDDMTVLVVRIGA